MRLVYHFSFFIPGIEYQLPCRPVNYVLGIAESIMYMIEIFGIPTAYDIISEWIKPTTRPLTIDELNLSKKYFGDTIQYDLVRVHPSANLTANSFALAYVSFNTINHWRPISKDVFIHEMMHVWQFQNLGAIYAIKALHAQYRGNAYDYGGFEGLYHAMLQGKALLSFNFEQQAEIIQDYCRLDNLEALNPMQRSVYYHYANQVMSVEG